MWEIVSNFVAFLENLNFKNTKISFWNFLTFIDEDALKYHIVQKYEKKSYYVDPSQIQQTLSSIASSNTSNVEAVSTAASSSFIGTTLTHRSNISRPSVPQAVASMPSPLS